MALSTGARLGPYEVLGPIGAGGMGEVYRARDTRLDRIVAIKVLPSNVASDPERRRRFEQEARAVSALNHPNICVLHDVGSDRGTDFLVMEHVEGRPLSAAIPPAGFSSSAFLRLAIQLADAVSAAHQRGVVHRDLKPANVMVSADNRVKVLDFGLARLKPRAQDDIDALQTTRGDITLDGHIAGTVAYMSPEQAGGGPIDHRTDIFSLGVVLYEMATGARPFRGDTTVSLLSAILKDDPRPVREVNPQAPVELERIVARCLTKDVEHRYQSAKDVRNALEELRRDSELGVPASRRGAPRALMRTRARRWAAIGATLAAMVIVSAALWWGVNRFAGSAGPALAFQERDWLLIADFDNRTGDAVFDRSLETALTVGIQQSKYVNVFPRSRVQQTLVRMRKPETAKLDENLAREVALREGIKAVLVCRVSRVGEDYSITAELLDPASQLVVASEGVRVQGRDGILAALDDLARRTRNRLGESLSSIAQGAVGLPAATTASLDALTAFAESRRPRAEARQQLLARAIELDPDFALAHADLGLLLYIANDRRSGEEHFKKALGLLDRLTLRERLWITAIVEDWRGNREQGLELYKSYLSHYPDDSGAWFRVGWTLMAITRQYSEAIKAFQRVLDLDPSSSAAHVNIATCYSGMQQREKARESYERAFKLNGDHLTETYVNHEYGFLLVKMGRLDQARRTFEVMTAASAPDKRARGRRSLALLAMYRGRYGEAIRELTDAVLINKTEKHALSELRDRLFLANALRTQGAAAASGRELDAIGRLLGRFEPGVPWLRLAGQSFARSGRTGEAAALLRLAATRMGDLTVSTSLNQSVRSDRAAYEVLKGEVELARGRYDAAVAALEEAERLEADSGAESLAFAEHRRGNLEKAAGWYLRILAQDTLGSERQESWILAHYHLGRIYAQQKEPDKAATQYEAFLSLWSEADVHRPAIADAKQRLARLQASRSS